MTEQEKIETEAIKYVKETTLYGEENAPLGSSARSYFETEKRCFIAGAKWQQEQEQNNENSWFNEYQEVEDYIIERIGNKFLEATPEKYNTASEATIALLESNWQQERMYSEEEVIDLLQEVDDLESRLEGKIAIRKWFEQFKKK